MAILKYLTLVVLLTVSPWTFAVSQGTVKFTNIIWPFYAHLNGPSVATPEGEKNMKVTGGYSLGGPVVYESDNSLFPVGKSFATNLILLSEKVGDNITLKGRTHWDDGYGNKFFGIVRRNDGTIEGFGAGGNGLLIFNEGEGIYKNLKMKCSYKINNRGRFVVVPLECRWIMK